jgi:hypothetical protein
VVDEGNSVRKILSLSSLLFIILINFVGLIVVIISLKMVQFSEYRSLFKAIEILIITSFNLVYAILNMRFLEDIIDANGSGGILSWRVKKGKFLKFVSLGVLTIGATLVIGLLIYWANSVDEIIMTWVVWISVFSLSADTMRRRLRMRS